MKLENAKAQMRKGLLELCVLSLVSDEEMYPSDIIKKLKSAKMIVVEGTIYPLLNRLKNEKLLSYSWQESTSGPPRKYYRTTDTGMEFLTELIKTWDTLSNAVKTSIKKPK